MRRKATTITISNDDRVYLELQTRTRTIQAQKVSRAGILLLKVDGFRIDDIADKVGMNRWSVMLCINKYLEGALIMHFSMLLGAAVMQRLRMMKKPGLSLLHARTLLTSRLCRNLDQSPTYKAYQ